MSTNQTPTEMLAEMHRLLDEAMRYRYTIGSNRLADVTGSQERNIVKIIRGNEKKALDIFDRLATSAGARLVGSCCYQK